MGRLRGKLLLLLAAVETSSSKIAYSTSRYHLPEQQGYGYVYHVNGGVLQCIIEPPALSGAETESTLNAQ